MVVACGAGSNVDLNILKEITENVVSLDSADNKTMEAFFKWVSDSISTSSRKVDLTKSDTTTISELPDPPPQIKLVL